MSACLLPDSVSAAIDNLVKVLGSAFIPKSLQRFSRRKSVFTAGFPKYVIKRSLSDRVVRERDSEANAASFSKEASQRQFL